MKQEKSLQRELYRWIILSALVLVVFGGAIAGAWAFQQARELQDNTLIEISLLVRNGQLDFSDFQSEEQHARRKKKISEQIRDRNDDFRDDHDIEDETTIIVHELGISDNLKGIPADISDGLKTITVGDDKWRVLVMSQFYSDRRFIIGQPTELRNNIAWSSSMSTFLPILLLVSMLLLMIHIIIRRQFKSLNLLVKSIDRQDGTQLKALSEKNIPQEIIPFVSSINALISRVKQVMQKQHRFIADAAHELRTPITALSLQAENVTRANTDAERDARQQQLKQGFDRLGNLVEQLLDLARLQSSDEIAAQTVSFNDVVKSAIADLFPLAESAEIDLGMVRQEKALNVKDQNGRLGQLVHNAIANAIHYTPANGKVDISLYKQGNTAVLLVEDSGIGIPEDELQQVMEPFYRVLESGKPGNGLGLAISHEIAEHLQGNIQLSNRKEGGLCFRYEQPLTND